MPDWSVCPHCSLKHRRRPDGQCPRCQQSVGGAADASPQAGASLPDVYDGRLPNRQGRAERGGAEVPSRGKPGIGSLIGGVLLLAAIGTVVKQKDRIVAGIRGVVGGEPIVLEVLDFKCESRGNVQVSGTVKNKSDKPLSLSVNLALRTDRMQIVRGNHVEPYPLPAGGTGRFDFNVNAPGFLGGNCLLQSFSDDTTSQAMKYTGDERLETR